MASTTARRFRYIDAHVHFWDPGQFTYEWLASLPAIAPRHTPAELKLETGACFPDAIVFVECGAPAREEVAWVERLAAAGVPIRGIVAHVDMANWPACADRLAEFARRPLVRGVRYVFQDEADPRYCVQPAFVAAVREAGRLGLSYDVCCRHPQLKAVLELVQACPDTRFILDHGGKPDIRHGLLDPWRADIAALAACPNLVCKFSGLVTEADHTSWTAAQLKPYVEHLLASFGPGRLLFGGDWPVAKLACAYTHWLETARALVAHRTAEEQDAIFHGNALTTYRLAAAPGKS